MKKPQKMRLDEILVLQGFAKNRSQAQAMVMSGCIFSGDNCLNKAGHRFSKSIELEVRGKPHFWVSRGGVKLNHAIDTFNINPEGRICADLGASTGGFTDVLLYYGAATVYAVDVGYGQLAWKLRTNKRVIVLDRINARNLSESQIPEKLDFLVVDVSFISLEKVLMPALNLMGAKAELVALIKPQFEVTKAQVGKGGVVRSAEIHKIVCDKVSNWISNIPQWKTINVIKSPISGPAGNIEFLLYAKRQGGV